MFFSEAAAGGAAIELTDILFRSTAEKGGQGGDSPLIKIIEEPTSL